MLSDREAVILLFCYVWSSLGALSDEYVFLFNNSKDRDNNGIINFCSHQIMPCAKPADEIKNVSSLKQWYSHRPQPSAALTRKRRGLQNLNHADVL